MRGDTDIKFEDFFSSYFGMTMMVSLVEGSKSHLWILLMTFQDLKISYPIKVVPENIYGVFYISAPNISIYKIIYT